VIESTPLEIRFWVRLLVSVPSKRILKHLGNLTRHSLAAPRRSQIVSSNRRAKWQLVLLATTQRPMSGRLRELISGAHHRYSRDRCFPRHRRLFPLRDSRARLAYIFARTHRKALAGTNPPQGKCQQKHIASSKRSRPDWVRTHSDSWCTADVQIGVSCAIGHHPSACVSYGVGQAATFDPVGPNNHPVRTNRDGSVLLCRVARSACR
jgi:hypothetical protein